MTALPRVACPVCRASVPLRRNGTLREHRDRRHHMHSVPGAVRDGLVPLCPGSGRWTPADQRDAGGTA